MPVTEVRWAGSENEWDFHVLRNNQPSSPLSRILVIDQAPGGSVLATNLPENTKITVEFKARIRGSPNNHGVIVDTSTGTVHATALPPSEPKLRSFIIQAIVTDEIIDPNGVTLKKEFKTEIRCHIHDTISRFWLTPSPLTVRRNSTGQRFSLLAQFSDDTVGVIPQNAGVTWKSHSDDIKFDDPNSGRITANAAASVAIISATLPPSLGGGNVSGAVWAADSWETPTAVTLVEGNAAKLEENFNFLFIPDGFSAAEKPQFERLVRGLVRDQTRRTTIKPYNILSNSINYWMAFIPSRESGMSVLSPMKPVSRDGNLRGIDMVPFIVDIENSPDGKCGSGIWRLPELVHEVGLPIPADKNQQFNTMLIWWKKWFGDEIEAHVNKCLYDKWQKLADLRIANERDTALGLAGGRPPITITSHGALKSRDARMVSWHTFRATRVQLDKFLSNLTHNGNTIGNTWVTGKDRPFVIVICGGGRRAGARTFPPNELIAISVTSETEVPLKPVVVQNPVVPSRAVDLIPFANPVNMPIDPSLTIFHEISHSFSLGDEYEEKPQLPKGEISFIERFLNIQGRDSLVDDPEVPAGGIIGLKIKWLWHRISKAGVLADTPFSIGVSDYRIKLKSNHASLFNVGDIVRLRKRPLVPNAVVSEELVVISKAHDGVDVSLLRGGGPDPESFTANSLESNLNPIIFEPVRKEIGGARKNLLLVSPKILQQISATGGPLNARRGNPRRVCDPNDEGLKGDRQYAINLPAELLQKTLPFRSRIVGLYESGGGYYCGVYHPTGGCLMRSSFDRGISGNIISLHNFCHVCRYVLVDRIDPSKHGLIDADYEGHYPL